MKEPLHKIQEELEEISPLMASLKKKQSDDMPEGYFDSLSDRVIANVTNGASSPKKRKVFRLSWVSIAASVALVLGVSFVLLTRTNQQTPDLANLTDVEILDYIETHISDFSIADIAELNESLTDFSETNINQADIEAYLHEGLDDISEESIGELLN